LREVVEGISRNREYALIAPPLERTEWCPVYVRVMSVVRSLMESGISQKLKKAFSSLSFTSLHNTLYNHHD
jgi:hypothetical protein